MSTDAILWAGVAALFFTALWLSRPRPRDWRPEVFFRGMVDLLTGAPTAVDPAPRLGAACTPDAVREWAAPPPGSGNGAPAMAAALGRRAATVLWWGPKRGVFPVTGWDELTLPEPGDADARAALELALEAALTVPTRRFVVIVTDAAEGFLPFFADVPGLRDRVRAVCLFGADLGAASEWLATSFTHERLDLELDRAIPWLTLRTGPGQVLPTPPPDPTGRESIEVIDLGEVKAPEAPSVGAALMLLLAAL